MLAFALAILCPAEGCYGLLNKQEDLGGWQMDSMSICTEFFDEKCRQIYNIKFDSSDFMRLHSLFVWPRNKKLQWLAGANLTNCLIFILAAWIPKRILFSIFIAQLWKNNNLDMNHY
jgi:hypothetical protein